MKRTLLLIPEGLTFNMLMEEQQAAINSVFGQFVNPMPGTVPSNGVHIVDAVTGDNFDPKAMGQFGIDWHIIFLGQWDGKSEAYNEIIIPIDEDTYINHMPEGQTPEGEPIPPTIAETHSWAGWPPIWKDVK